MAKTLTVYLAADLKKFNGGMKDAERQVNGFGGTLKNKLGPALIAAGAAAGAFAVKLGIDGVKAAMEDEKAVAALATTLDNLNLSHDTAAVEDYIRSLERSYGVADTELRPAYDRLVRSTKDTQEANRALKIAMDISAATGKSLSTVTDSLGRAYDGNTTSLGRLGLGIDRTALASMSLDDILTQLAQTFGGQADAEARTFEGQLRRLETASDNLTEAFGAGLLKALGDTNDTTQDLVDAMGDLEPLLEDLGGAVADFGSDVIYLVDAMVDLKDSAEGATANLSFMPGVLDAIRAGAAPLINPLGFIADSLRKIRGESAGASTTLRQTADQMERGIRPATEAASEATEDYRWNVHGAQGALARMYASMVPVTQETQSTGRASGSAAREVDKLTKAQERLVDQYEVAGIAFQTTKRDLIDQIQTLADATQAVEDYANTIQQDLLAGIDLGGLYAAQFDEEGNRTGTSLIEGFNRAIDQAEYFGNVLTAIKAQGADQSLIDQIAGLGPETGGALAQQLLDEGLIPTMNDKWTNVQAVTKELALGLVPEFLEAGRLSAIDSLNGLATQFGKDQRKFKRLGNKLGQQVGDEFAARALKEIRDAVREVEAIATAARAEAVAAAQANQARITEQAVATAIAGLIRNSDQRTGRNVQPVLQ
jgi:hypothetical protein